MRLEIRYVTSFEYPHPARDSHNVLRACPATTPTQTLISYQVETAPNARVFSHYDYWGTRVDSFGIRPPHRRLVVVADSVVETAPPPIPGNRPPRSALAGEDFLRRHWEYLQPTRHTDWDEALAAEAAELVAGRTDAIDAIQAIHQAAAVALEYSPGATYVGVDVVEVRKAGKGVCQDFVHLALAMYRSQSIPARYVSGYFYAADPAVGAMPEAPEVQVQTHAWLEVALPDFGWWGLDPTNPQEAGPRHVKIGHGRDYDDVLPLRGTYHGPTKHDLAVNVRMTRESMAAYQQQQ